MDTLVWSLEAVVDPGVWTRLECRGCSVESGVCSVKSVVWCLECGVWSVWVWSEESRLKNLEYNNIDVTCCALRTLPLVSLHSQLQSEWY